jgi:hypothetical protein
MIPNGDTGMKQVSRWMCMSNSLTTMTSMKGSESVVALLFLSVPAMRFKIGGCSALLVRPSDTVSNTDSLGERSGEQL